MKQIGRFISMLVIFTMFAQIVLANDQDWDAWVKFSYNDHVGDVKKILQQLDIVRDINKYTPESNISRRDAFQMAFIVKTGGRVLTYRLDDVDYIESHYNVSFADVESGTYDYALAYSLVWENLIAGVPYVSSEDGETTEVRADLYRDVTYGEALTIIGRMLYDTRDWRGLSHEYYEYIDISQPNPFYNTAIKNGLIYSVNSDMGAPLVTEDMLDKPISAYEFLHLLYRALYIPTIKLAGDYTPSIYFETRFINNYFKLEKIDVDEEDLRVKYGDDFVEIIETQE